MILSNYEGLLVSLENTLGSVLPQMQVVVRKKVIVLDQDLLPMVILAPGKSGEKIRKGGAGQTFPGNDGQYNIVWSYPIVIGIVSAGNAYLLSDLQQVMFVRQTIRNQIYQVNPIVLPNGISKGPWDVSIDMDDVISEAAWSNTTYDLTGLVVNYDVAETRTT